LAEIHHEQGDLAAAKEACCQAIVLDAELAEAYVTLGNICLDLDKTREALHNYQKFLECEHSTLGREIRAEVAALVEGLKAEMS
jgi:tetratricopeptide (TPR) repeat protein